MYTYNCSDEFDELYNLNDPEAQNLARSEAHRDQYIEMVRYMGAFLEKDPRWRGYWHTFRLDRYNELPRMDAADVQMFKPI
jgi:hypothetical protein